MNPKVKWKIKKMEWIGCGAYRGTKIFYCACSGEVVIPFHNTNSAKEFISRNVGISDFFTDELKSNYLDVK